MKEDLIKNIIEQIDSSKNTILSEWSYLDGVGGYLIRKDGEIFTTGDDSAQKLSSETYSNLNQLNQKELAKILANLDPDSDLLDDMKASPDCFSYANTEQILNWATTVPDKGLKIK